MSSLRQSQWKVEKVDLTKLVCYWRTSGSVHVQQTSYISVKGPLKLNDTYVLESYIKPLRWFLFTVSKTLCNDSNNTPLKGKSLDAKLACLQCNTSFRLKNVIPIFVSRKGKKLLQKIKSKYINEFLSWMNPRQIWCSFWYYYYCCYDDNNNNNNKLLYINVI